MVIPPSLFTLHSSLATLHSSRTLNLFTCLVVPRFPSSWLPLAAIVALAAILRCNHLGDLSFWFDESFCWKMATFDLDEVWRRTALDNHPPLYFYLLWFWERAFGDSPSATRSLSVVCGLGTVVGAYLLARTVGTAFPENSKFKTERPDSNNPSAGLLAAALLALSPFQIDWSQQVRMYVLGACLTLVSSWLLLRALAPARPRWQDFAWYTLAATALAYTHYFGLLVVGGQFLFAVGAALRSGGAFTGATRPDHRGYPIAGVEGGGNLKSKIANPKVVTALAAFWAVGTLWSPWLPIFLRHRRQVIGLFWSEQFTWEQVARACFEMFRASSHDSAPGMTVVWGAAGACLVLAIGMVALGRYAQRLCGVVILTTFAGAIAASLWGRNIIVARYFIFAHALILCGVAMAVVRIRWKGLRSAVMAAVIFGAAWAGSRYAQRREELAAKPGMAAAMAYLADVWTPGEPVVVASPLVQVTADSHALKRMPVQVLHDGGELPYFLGTAVMRDDEFISPAALASSPAKNAWFVDVIDGGSGTWTVRLPDPWVDVAEEAFPEWSSPKSEIVVRRCEKRPRAARSGERQVMRSTK